LFFILFQPSINLIGNALTTIIEQDLIVCEFYRNNSLVFDEQQSCRLYID
jgi:hypothetical protein